MLLQPISEATTDIVENNVALLGGLTAHHHRRPAWELLGVLPQLLPAQSTLANSGGDGGQAWLVTELVTSGQHSPVGVGFPNHHLP